MKWLHKRIYADAAAAMPLTSGAKRELERLLPLGGNPGALHQEAQAAKRELEAARKKVADAIGAHADEIIFTGSGTEANNLALLGVLRPLLLERGEVGAITSAIEHSSVLEPLRALERDGLYTMLLPVDERGVVDPKQLREVVNQDTALVSVQMVNSEIGAVQDIRAIAKEVRHIRRTKLGRHTLSGHGDFPTGKSPEVLAPVALTTSSEGTSPSLLLHTDASQAPLWVPLNVEKLGVDLMTLDAQKVGGPKGVGMLYVRRGTLVEPIIFGGGQESGLRSGTENVASVAAFAAALEEAQAGAEARAAHVGEVRDFLWSEIQKVIPDAILNGPAVGGATSLVHDRIPNNIHISIPGLDGEMAVIALDAAGVAASTRSACDTDERHPSHVLEALGVAPELAAASLRLTLTPGITRAQARAIARALQKVVARYRPVL